ncbi:MULTISPECIES: hypothetical protein [unclassified Acinetobacter]|uniref:hypothetical protein n=1 Tax=unclassified Acinetobacter TaxID=196816 RepID=UPI0002CD89C2|nr:MULTISPECIES: hypothetical protein [unclassified Acinetobacter]ENX41485.1 hypothetical protein F887_01881 [Acinetobacter sp. NIPH 2100]MCH7313010.1 hypothetical protein [Acinetobacter sp. ANC 3882]
MINTTYKLISRFNNKESTYGQYVEKEQIDIDRLKVMYSIYEQYYENTKFSIFVDDFKKKSGAILIFNSETDEIVGFSTVVVQHFYLNGKDYTVLFSGDTVILRAYWGTRTLQSTMLKLMIKLRVKYPFNELYWLLISKGYKTYLLLANNYYVYYPNIKDENQHLSTVVEHYCENFFGEYYDKEAGLLNFGNDYQPLKGEVAPITEEMRAKNPNIHFFEQMNPTWTVGTELPCIGRLGWKDLARFPVKLITKPASKGRCEALLKTPANRQGVLQ